MQWPGMMACLGDYGGRGSTSFDLKCKEGGIRGAGGLEGTWLSGDDPAYGPGKFLVVMNQCRPNGNDMGHQFKRC